MEESLFLKSLLGKNWCPGAAQEPSRSIINQQQFPVWPPRLKSGCHSRSVFSGVASPFSRCAVFRWLFLVFLLWADFSWVDFDSSLFLLGRL